MQYIAVPVFIDSECKSPSMCIFQITAAFIRVVMHITLTEENNQLILLIVVQIRQLPGENAVFSGIITRVQHILIPVRTLHIRILHKPILRCDLVLYR